MYVVFKIFNFPKNKKTLFKEKQFFIYLFWARLLLCIFNYIGESRWCSSLWKQLFEKCFNFYLV